MGEEAVFYHSGKKELRELQEVQITSGCRGHLHSIHLVTYTKLLVKLKLGVTNTSNLPNLKILLHKTTSKETTFIK